MKSAGPPAGTLAVPGAPVDNSDTLTSAGSAVIYTAGTTNNWGLWSSDGSSATKITTFTGYPPHAFSSFGSSVFFWVYNGGYQLWRSTPSAATLVNTFPAMMSVTSTVAMQGSTGYFLADDGVHGTEMWKTDGTPAGTSMILDLNPGSGSGAATTHRGIP